MTVVAMRQGGEDRGQGDLWGDGGDDVQEDSMQDAQHLEVMAPPDDMDVGEVSWSSAVEKALVGRTSKGVLQTFADDVRGAENVKLLGELNERIHQVDAIEIRVQGALSGSCSLEEARTVLEDAEKLCVEMKTVVKLQACVRAADNAINRAHILQEVRLCISFDLLSWTHLFCLHAQEAYSEG